MDRLNSESPAVAEPSMDDVVMVYRHSLFQASETFVARQFNATPWRNKLLVGNVTRLVSGSVPTEKVVALNQPSAGTPRAASRLWKDDDEAPLRLAALRHEAALVHAHFAIDAARILPVARQLNLPLITTLHGFDVTSSNSSFALNRNRDARRFAHRQRSLQRHGTLFLCVSEAIRRAAVEKGYPEDRLLVHYIGVDGSPTTSTQQPPLRSSAEVLHVARLVEKKGTADLIRAFHKVVVHVPEAVLRIVGNGPLGNKLEAMAQTLGIAGNIIFEGDLPHDRVLDLMQTCTVLAAPSKTAANGDSEGLPTVLMEGLARGTPVVATRHSGIPELVRHQESGLLVSEGDVAALAASICALFEDPSLARRLARRGQQLVRGNFDVSNQAKALAGIYRETITGEVQQS